MLAELRVQVELWAVEGHVAVQMVLLTQVGIVVHVSDDEFYGPILRIDVDFAKIIFLNYVLSWV